jgi:uncharacterized protein with GYD domain
MPHYLVLVNWTDQGARDAKNTVQRYDAAVAAGARMGVTFTSFYWTMGAHDAVGIVEAADDSTMSRFALAIGGEGNIRTVTARAYTRDEMAQILKR